MLIATSVLIAYAVLISILAVIASRAKLLGKIITAVIGVAATILMVVLFQTWLVVLWGALLATIVFFIFKTDRIIKIVLIALLLIVYVGGYFILKPIAQERFGDGFGGPSAPITVPVVESACQEAIIIESQTHGGKVELDLNDGDPFNYSLTIVSPNTPSSTETLVVLAEPGSIFDVVHPVVYFTSYRLDGTLDQALCSASKLAGDKAFAYVFVGKAATPEGWTTVSTTGWWTELVAKQYSEKPITPGGTWAAFQVEANNKANTITAKAQLVYGQMWNPNEPGVVVHFQIEKGYEFTNPAGWQGTYWTVVDADPVLVQDRFVQASKEVVERDALIITGNDVTLFYCGATTPTTELKIGTDSLKWTADIVALNLDRFDPKFKVEDFEKTDFAGWTCTINK